MPAHHIVDAIAEAFQTKAEYRPWWETVLIHLGAVVQPHLTPKKLSFFPIFEAAVSSCSR